MKKGRGGDVEWWIGGAGRRRVRGMRRGKEGVRRRGGEINRRGRGKEGRGGGEEMTGEVRWRGGQEADTMERVEEEGETVDGWRGRRGRDVKREWRRCG